ncbi:MAG: DUF2333 family protein [Gammaproteobacteria bacterium]|nr:DUF2333 family protein [Gammaproteobacteria bacterium]
MTELSDALKDEIAGVRGPASSEKKVAARGIVLTAVLLIAVVVMSGIAIYVSIEPRLFAAPKNKDVIGYSTTETVIQMTDVLLHKRGGFMANDILPPFSLLDNMPAWEKGVLVQIRDMSRALRKDIARSQSQSTEDADLAKAEPFYHLGMSHYMFPASEDEYKLAMSSIKAYQARLLDVEHPNAQFYARADNLRNWLQDVETRLGSMSQRLSASVDSTRENLDYLDDNAGQSTPSSSTFKIQTPWYEIDDVFFEARGTAWALAQLLKAIQVDFRGILEKKNATASVDQIIRELEATQEMVMSPVILNGSGFGLFANHSLVMANYISRANAAIIDLRALMEQG